MASFTTAHPVQTLREHSTNFEAALAVCLAAPKVKAVHKLRTESRRLEAQIALLKSVKNLPPFAGEAAKTLWQIKKLRQAAGRVRDLDVQSDHLRRYAKKKRTGALLQDEKEQIASDVAKMVEGRASRRKHAAAALLKAIGARQAKVTAALEKLNSALKDAARHGLSSAELLALTQRQFARTPALRLRKPSADDLHTVRKAAKRARYLAENAGSTIAATAAKRYEHLQELGGEWHDWLDLSAAAREELGKKHVVATQFAALCDHNLQLFRTELTDFLASVQPSEKRSGKRKK